MGFKVSFTMPQNKSFTATQLMIQERMRAMGNWKTPMKMISMVMFKAVMLNFRTQGQRIIPGGWAPLSQVTLDMRRKGKGKGSPRILQNTGALMLNVAPAATQDEATTTSNMPYSLTMQNGRRAGEVIANIPESTRILKPRRGTRLGTALGSEVVVKAHQRRMPAIPARPFMMLNKDDKKQIDLIGLMVIQGRIK